VIQGTKNDSTCTDVPLADPTNLQQLSDMIIDQNDHTTMYCGVVRLPYYPGHYLHQFWIQTDFNTYVMYFLDADTLELKYSYIEETLLSSSIRLLDSLSI
jgi:hypothetical protein